MVNARKGTAPRRLGLLVWLSLAAFVAAAVLHHLSRLPASYTWFEPLRTLRRVVRMPRFPLAVVAVYALGAWAWRGEWDLEALARRLARALPARELLPLALRPLFSIALVALVDAFVFGSERDVLDSLALVAIGFALATKRRSRAQITRELAYAALSAAVFLAICYAYTISKALTFSDGRGFDAAIVGLEQALFGVPPHRALARWTSAHLDVAQLFDWVYFHFFEHMALTTVLLMALRKRAQRTEYLGALAVCYLLGGPLYRLFPAYGPGYFEPQYFDFVSDPRLMSGVMSRYLRHNTDAALAGTAHQVRTWGYVACMPSLHIAQELVMSYYARGSRPAFVLSLGFTLLTLLAVVALGWHYSIDALAGAFVALLAILIARWQSSSLMPSCFGPDRDHAPPPGKAVLLPFFRAYRVARRAREAGPP